MNGGGGYRNGLLADVKHVTSNQPLRVRAHIVFSGIKAQIDRDVQAYETKCERLSENAKKRYEQKHARFMLVDLICYIFLNSDGCLRPCSYILYYTKVYLSMLFFHFCVALDDCTIYLFSLW